MESKNLKKKTCALFKKCIVQNARSCDAAPFKI